MSLDAHFPCSTVTVMPLVTQDLALPSCGQSQQLMQLNLLPPPGRWVTSLSHQCTLMGVCVTPALPHGSQGQHSVRLAVKQQGASLSLDVLCPLLL